MKCIVFLACLALASSSSVSKYSKEDVTTPSWMSAKTPEAEATTPTPAIPDFVQNIIATKSAAWKPWASAKAQFVPGAYPGAYAGSPWASQYPGMWMPYQVPQGYYGYNPYVQGSWAPGFPQQGPVSGLWQGQQPSVYGQEAQMYGQQVPVYGQQAPIYGQQTPVYGQQSPVYGRQAPIYGQQYPVYGQQAPVYGQQAPIYGQ